ncbi:MAG: alpha/beta fold hydrolase, partial [Phenylobacterium sp.]|uniref:alpha/beta hydrolase n=1 Tax=Phenylobacterium sp. TaxID=1871053 RepID=UPI001A636034
SEELARRGVASLRFDKRGVGGSQGTYLTTGFHDETADAGAALAALGGALPSAGLVVTGHSVGATLAMRLAARAKLSGVVLLAGAARRGADVMRAQSAKLAETLNGPSRLLGPALRLRQAIARRRLERSTEDVLRVGGADLPARWFREYMAHDPVDDLRAIRCPVLAITGADDVQVEPSDVGRIGAAIDAPFTGETPTGISHLLRRTCGAPGLASYAAEMRSPPDPGVLARVCDWIEAEARGTDRV